MPVLEVVYESMSSWALPLRAAIDSQPALRIRDAQWNQGRLSDLAFAVSTRLGYLPEITRLIDENLVTLDREVAGKREEIDSFIRDGVAYRFNDYNAVRRVLIGAASFISESRACFESLADFYHDFLVNYFDDRIGDDAARYAAIAGMTATPQWATDLKNARHDLLHSRSLWIAFEVRDGSPRYEPLLILNWRPGHFQPEDCIKFQRLREIRASVLAAAVETRNRLVQRVKSL